MILSNYIAQRRKQIEERIAAETLAGNEVKLATEKAALAELDAVEREMIDVCVWKENDDGAWETDCGKIFELFDGTPYQNGMRYCYHCGRKLRRGK